MASNNKRKATWNLIKKNHGGAQEDVLLEDPELA
jgi:hypothetical protein